MNDIAALRSHLFNTLAALQDKENPMDIERAKAVCEVGTVIINTAKAEIDFARVNGSVDTQFFHKPNANQPTLPAPKPMNDDFDEDDHPLKDYTTKNGNVTVKGNVLTHKMK